MNTSDILNRAADLIEQRGWAEGGGWVHEGDDTDAPLCLEGGIMAAVGITIPAYHTNDRVFEPLHACPAYKAVTSYLDREPARVLPNGLGIGGSPLYFWNDDEAGSAERVIEVLRACAVIEASRERETAAVTA